MESHLKYSIKSVALLVLGSAILLNSCTHQQQAEPLDEENLISRTVDTLKVISSDNGEKVSVFAAPLMEDYEFASVPFSEYRKGVEMTSYDSLGAVSSYIIADYALHWTNRDMWELKGNVRVEGDDRKLFTQQLYYDIKIRKIYSNVDSRVEEGGDVFIGEGFDADDDFSRWTFRRLKGRVGVNVEPNRPEERMPEQAANDSVPS